MDGHEHQPLTDEALDREIAAALDVEPSLEFRARVRARVATEPVHVPWWRSPAWAGVSFAAAAAAVLLVGWTVWTPDPLAVEPPRIVARAPVHETAPVPEVTSEPPVIRMASDERPQAPRVVRGSEVLVSAEEASSLRHLLAAIAQQRVEPALPILGAGPAPLAPIEDIVVEPISLSPIAGLDSE